MKERKMRQVKKEDAIRDYGVRYVPSLEALDLRLGREGNPAPRDVLAEKLEKLSKPNFDGTIRLVEELGAPTQSFHYKDLRDVHDRYETEERAHYAKTLETFGDLMTANIPLLEKAAESEKPEQQRLKAAFEKAYEKMVMIDQFLASGLSFKVGTRYLDDTLTLPDTIAKAGDAVFVVKDDGKALPSLAEATISQRDFGASFFSKASVGVSYDINTAGASPAREENKFFGIDATEAKAPAGAVAKSLNQLAFNSKAGAIAYLGEVLEARETGLKAQLKEVRAARRQLGKTAP
jgi:hypothetical protein